MHDSPRHVLPMLRFAQFPQQILFITLTYLETALGAQTKSLYRYGHSSECSHKFEDFKFCLSNKSLPEDDKRAAWIQRRAEWWARRRIERSSEDVWDIRTYVNRCARWPNADSFRNQRTSTKLSASICISYDTRAGRNTDTTCVVLIVNFHIDFLSVFTGNRPGTGRSVLGAVEMYGKIQHEYIKPFKTTENNHENV